MVGVSIGRPIFFIEGAAWSPWRVCGSAFAASFSNCARSPSSTPRQRRPSCRGAAQARLVSLWCRGRGPSPSSRQRSSKYVKGPGQVRHGPACSDPHLWRVNLARQSRHWGPHG
eukprot:scaffold8107_cov363-Prasinococcus_capsulatus_cf.AAC.5